MKKNKTWGSLQILIEKDAIVERRKSKEVLALHRKAVTTINQIKIKTLEVVVAVTFERSISACITIFDRATSENRSFTIYSFYSPDKNKKIFDAAISLIKSDDFVKVVSAQVAD